MTLGPGFAMTLHLINGDVHGARVAESRMSPVRVHAGRWDDLPSLLSAGIPSAPGSYIFTGPSQQNPSLLAVRPGEANDVRRRLLEHSNDVEKSSFHSVYVVTGIDGRLTKTDVRYLEARYHELVQASQGAILDVEKIPSVAGCAPADREVLEALLWQSRQLLHCAGCRAFDLGGLPMGLEGPEVDDAAVRVDFEGGSPSDSDEHELIYDGVWARGYALPDGFVVRAGSDIRRRENAALLGPMTERRRYLLRCGVLGEIPGVLDRWRLMRDILVASELTAAKIVTGAHQSNRGIWRRLSPTDRLIIAR